MDKEQYALRYRALCKTLLNRFYLEVSQRLNPESYRVYDKQLADMLGISQTAFSLLRSGASSMSSLVFYKLLCFLTALGVDLSNYFELQDDTLRFLRDSSPDLFSDNTL